MCKKWYVYSMKDETGYDAGVVDISKCENIISKINEIEKCFGCEIVTLMICKNEKEAHDICYDWNTTWIENNQHRHIVDMKGGE